MNPRPAVRFAVREATSADADAIAALHAGSWRRYYRGALSDDFLEHEVDDDRRKVWRSRLGESSANTRTVLAHRNSELVGFAHVVFDDDPTWGSLLDNLHVRHDHHRSGIGRYLVGEIARTVVAATAGALYLWVLEQNVGAQRFYAELGGAFIERVARDPQPGYKLRVFWPDATSLIP